VALAFCFEQTGPEIHVLTGGAGRDSWIEEVWKAEYDSIPLLGLNPRGPRNEAAYISIHMRKEQRF